MNVLEVKNIEKYYGKKDVITKAVDDVSFNVEKKEFVGIMGASGSGKTTLLNCISTIDHLTSGEILVDGKDISLLKGKDLQAFRREHLGFIFQDFNLLDSLTGFENISLALTMSRVSKEETKARVEEIAASLNIKDCLNKYPYEMSGGQKQRIASARAIIHNPSLILADEPTGALDSKSSGLLLEALQNLNDKLNATILMVTHDAFSASFCRRILFLKDGKIFNEIYRGNLSRHDFFEKIVEVISLLGGDLNAC